MTHDGVHAVDYDVLLLRGGHATRFCRALRPAVYLDGGSDDSDSHHVVDHDLGSLD